MSDFRSLEILLAEIRRWDEFQNMLGAMAEAQRCADQNRVPIWIWRSRSILGGHRYSMLAPSPNIPAEPWLLVRPRGDRA